MFKEGAYHNLTSVEFFTGTEDELTTVHQWCYLNIKEQYEFVYFRTDLHHLSSCQYRILAWFANKSDAASFKITWKSS